MNIAETKNKVDSVLADRGLVRECKEQAVRLLLYHLYIAIDIYRFMTFAEKAKAGYWYRIFKGSFSLTGFLKERKRKRDKEKSPLHPSYKKESGVEEKGEKTTHTVGREIRDLTERQMAFWLELEQYIGKYDRQTVLRFFYYWAEEDKRSGKMKYEAQSSWNTKYRLAIWSRRSFEVNDQAAAVRLERAISGGKVKAVDAEQQAIAARREEDNARLEQEIKARKEGAVSYEEYIRRKNKTTT